ncbi:OmpA family protein [bacterium]|nr:OmpA family protein [bacterium]
MKNKFYASCYGLSRLMMAASVVALAACADTIGSGDASMGVAATPTVDYVERLDVYSAPHQDSFLNQLAMNYRSFAIYNARTSGYPEMGEIFAQKAVAAFSGEVPFPETLDNWNIDDEQVRFELHNAYNDMLDLLKNDASETNPDLSAEMQAKFDCWMSATASGQTATANQCRARFNRALTALRDCTGGRVVAKNTDAQSAATTTDDTATSQSAAPVVAKKRAAAGDTYYPDTRDFQTVNTSGTSREGLIIVNNVNIPEHLINPVPVQPMVFNQNIYGGDRTVSNSHNNVIEGGAICVDDYCDEPVGDDGDMVMPAPTPTPTAPVAALTNDIPAIGDELVSREEFINMMMAMRAELAAINARLDQIQASAGEKTMIKVQQIPLEPKQHVMEEIFEIRFDFNESTIKPEYQELIKKLATATQNNKNIKVSVVGHTDTVGSTNYNYALGGRRADAVQKMLIQYGIPAGQIVAVSAGEEGLKVPTPDGVANAENRRVRVVKEVHFTEPAPAAPWVAVDVEEFSTADCGLYGCDQ